MAVEDHDIRNHISDGKFGRREGQYHSRNCHVESLVRT
jgi:hypothetical protein